MYENVYLLFSKYSCICTIWIVIHSAIDTCLNVSCTNLALCLSSCVSNDSAGLILLTAIQGVAPNDRALRFELGSSSCEELEGPVLGCGTRLRRVLGLKN